MSPDFELEIALARILERARRWVGFVPLLAKVIRVNPFRSAIRSFIRKIRDGRLAEQFGGHQMARPFSGPSSIELDVEV
jgi:hypothetical protein